MSWIESMQVGDLTFTSYNESTDRQMFSQIAMAGNVVENSSWDRQIYAGDRIYTVTLTSTGRIVGFLGIYRVMRDDREIAIVVSEEFRSNGFGTIMLEQGLRIINRDFPKAGVWSLISYVNQAARVMLEDCAFVPVASKEMESPNKTFAILGWWYHLENAKASKVDMEFEQ